MSKCPQCKQEIYYLLERQRVMDYFIVRLDGSGVRDLEYGRQLNSEPLDGQRCWECPECFETVAETKDQAISILVGKGKEEV